MLKKIVLIALVSSGAFAAHQIEVNANDRDGEGQVRLDIGRMGSTLQDTYIGVRYLNGDSKNSDKISDIDPLMEVSFMVERPVRSVYGLTLGLGIKGEMTKFDGHRYAAIPLGVEAQFQLPLDTAFPFYLGGELYYAPSVFCFEAGDEYTEGRIALSIEPIDNGRLFVGYRKIDTDTEHAHITYNDSVYFGMRLDF